MIPIAPFLAHLVTTGLGPVYDGLTHFMTSPEELAPVLALALLVGLRAPANSRWALFVLPASWLIGGSAGLAAKLGVSGAWTAVTLVIIGGLVAWNPQLPLWATTSLAALLGFFLGFLDGVGMARPELGVKAVCGSATGVFVVVALVSAFVISLRVPWTRIAVRVAGSWISAIGLLLLGWSLRAS